jgi:hypothetical protein
VFTYLPDAGDFVYGGAVGAALHCGTMIAAVVVLADDEFPMTLQEDHRFFGPVSFDGTYLVKGTSDRRTRTTLWTSTTIEAESTGQTVADSTAVNQLIKQPVAPLNDSIHSIHSIDSFDVVATHPPKKNQSPSQ